MYTVIGMNSICNPNLKHKGVQFLEVSRVYKHLRFTPVPLTNPKITFEVFKIWKQKTIFVVKSQMTQFFEDSLFRNPSSQVLGVDFNQTIVLLNLILLFLYYKTLNYNYEKLYEIIIYMYCAFTF